MTVEETRALAFLVSAQRRAAAEGARAAQLRGNPAALAGLIARWQPILWRTPDEHGPRDAGDGESEQRA